MIEWLKGKKTYIVAVLGAGINLAITFGIIPEETRETINIILAALGLGTIRAAIAKK